MTAILDQFGTPIRVNGRKPLSARPVPSPRSIRAKYDLAQTTDQNSAHWANADALDADAANSLSVRKTLRERARYEVANNSYLRGIVLTLANHEVGTGPTLQMQTTNASQNAAIEAAWEAWADAVDLAGKLRTMVAARVVDGESFAVLVSNPAIDDEVKLDLRPVECDQVTAPTFAASLDANYIDGIRFDAYGNPQSYDILKRHPGATYLAYSGNEAETWPAESVVHLFRADRPGQHRGITEIGPGLSLFPGMRRFTLATIKAAEVAADIAVAFETDLPPGELPDEIDPGSVDIPMGTMFQSPYGWKAKQIAAEHPNSEFTAFRRSTINEAARCVNMPPNIAMCDSADYNFASGRLDHQTYFGSIGVAQSHTARRVLRRVFAAWFREAVGRYGWTFDRDTPPPFAFYWVGQPYCDPQAEASAIETNLRTGMTTYPAEYARRGLDWQTEHAKQAEAVGLTPAEYQERLRDAILPATGGGAIGGGAAMPAVGEETGIQDAAESSAAGDAGETDGGTATKPAPETTSTAVKRSSLLEMVGGISGILDIFRALAAGEITRETAVSLVVLFYQVSPAEAEAIVGKSGEQPPKAKPEPGQNPAAPPFGKNPPPAKDESAANEEATPDQDEEGTDDETT